MHISKPPPGTLVDWQHPLAQGLAAFWPFNDGGVLVNDATSMGNAGTVTAWDAGTNWFGGAEAGLNIGGLGAYVSVPSQVCFDLPGNFTIAFRIRYGTGSQTYPGVIDKIRGDQSSPAWSVHINTASTPFFRFQPKIGGASWTFDSSTISASADWTAVLVRQADNFTWYVSGLAPTTAVKAGAITTNTTAIKLGSMESGRWLAGCFYWAGIWNAALQPEAVASLMGNPWQMMWERRKYWFVGAAAGGYGRIIGSSILRSSMILPRRLGRLVA
jgi:hypothetical protein